MVRFFFFKTYTLLDIVELMKSSSEMRRSMIGIIIGPIRVMENPSGLKPLLNPTGLIKFHYGVSWSKVRVSIESSRIREFGVGWLMAGNCHWTYFDQVKFNFGVGLSIVWTTGPSWDKFNQILTWVGWSMFKVAIGRIQENIESGMA